MGSTTATTTTTTTTAFPTYTHLPAPIQGTAPPVIIFFSFLDATSHHWATQSHVANNIRRAVPAGTTVARYHVSNDKTGFAYGSELTRAWAVATHLHVDDKVLEPLFDAVWVQRTATDLAAVRELFWRVANIDKHLFDRTWNDHRVVADAEYQERLTAELPREKLPCIVINGEEVIDGNEVRHMVDDPEFGRNVGLLVRDLMQSKAKERKALELEQSQQ
jgi:protein dithiol oxidoreductase (disulfide-forming)